MDKELMPGDKELEMNCGHDVEDGDEKFVVKLDPVASKLPLLEPDLEPVREPEAEPDALTL
ncbi:hypothetical protein EYF80_020791 [Liparis tanakae]|uniref:Uncharacterized protein n=1 Tax=Liparis tanakae TaxID=230148 RepID=A0A4Z2HTF0_9TELE|nr:hypothetical protein EYF80_020791 [Liparis tanakae]